MFYEAKFCIHPYYFLSKTLYIMQCKMLYLLKKFPQSYKKFLSHFDILRACNFTAFIRQTLGLHVANHIMCIFKLYFTFTTVAQNIYIFLTCLLQCIIYIIVLFHRVYLSNISVLSIHFHVFRILLFHLSISISHFRCF